jgi:hypothetical protein
MKYGARYSYDGVTSYFVAGAQLRGAFKITYVQGGSHVHNQVSTPGKEKVFPLSIYVKK